MISVFQGIKNQIVIGSVIEGNTCGDVYVDCCEEPSFAVLWNKMDAVLIAGVQNEGYLKSFGQLVGEVFEPHAVSRVVPFLNIYYPDETWADIVRNNLEDLKPEKVLRHYFEFYSFPETFIPTDAFELKRVDGDLLGKKCALKNLKRVTGWIESFWPSIGCFLDKGIGYCLIQDQTIVNWCLSVFKVGRQVELGLETVEGYGCRGFAKQVSTACIRYCLKHGLQPLWNCEARNFPSVRVAKAIGFVKKEDYYVWHIKLMV